jgi:hypothetical protein
MTAIILSAGERRLLADVTAYQAAQGIMPGYVTTVYGVMSCVTWTRYLAQSRELDKLAN